MVRVKFRCVVLGHENRMRRSAGRVYLECGECGRQTEGWQLGKEQPAAAHTVPPLEVFQQLAQGLWQRLREGFASVGLR